MGLAREKPKRTYDGPKSVTAKCCRALPPSKEVDVNYNNTLSLRFLSAVDIISLSLFSNVAYIIQKT